MTETDKKLLLLQCIFNAGVDNWDGLDYAYEEYEERLKAIELEEELAS